MQKELVLFQIVIMENLMAKSFLLGVALGLTGLTFEPEFTKACGLRPPLADRFAELLSIHRGSPSQPLQRSSVQIPDNQSIASGADRRASRSWRPPARLHCGEAVPPLIATAQTIRADDFRTSSLCIIGTSIPLTSYTPRRA